MDSHYDDALVTALIETIAAWTHRDKDRLASILCAHCWPGGIADRRDPSGVQSLRRWRPGGTAPALPSCSCVRGRCTVCN
jgi:hypothetical protein